jgi:hypothetical protein
MKTCTITAILILAAVTKLHAQAILDIEPGWPRDSAMKVLKGKYRVADTVVIPGRNYDHIIRMAPVDLAGYGGYLVIHSDSMDKVTSIVWLRARYNIFEGDPFPWNTFRDWEKWELPTLEEYRAILTQIAPRYTGWVAGVIRYEGQSDSTARNHTKAWFKDTVRVGYLFSPARQTSEIRFIKEILLPIKPGITDAPLNAQHPEDGE